MLVWKTIKSGSVAIVLLFLSQGCQRLETSFQALNSDETLPGSQFSSLLSIDTNNRAINQSKKQFPDDIGWINIKEDYGAKGDGKTDDTQAILQALENNKSADYTRPMVIYFPKGTYLVSDTLQFQEVGKKCCVVFQGQGQAHTVIKLQDQSPEFSNPEKPKAVIRTRSGNIAFRNYIRDLTLDTGIGNPGAIGIDYIANNRGAIKDVTIKSGDGQGQVGIEMVRQWPGPSLIKNVLIEGFDYGIRVRHRIYSVTLEHITLKNQKVVGIDSSNVLAIRGLKTIGSVPVIRNRRGGLVVVLDGEFQSQSSQDHAIRNQGYLYLRNTKAVGYQSIVNNQGSVVPGLFHNEYISHPVKSLFDSPKHSLNLPIKETPTFHDNNLRNWANVKDFPSVEAAMNSGKSTIYFPQGEYQLQDVINVPASVRKIIGFESILRTTKDENRAVFRIAQNSQHPLIIEGLLMTAFIDHFSPRTLVLQHTKASGYLIRNYPQSGKLFLEDVQTHLNLEHPQDIWARQLNPETLHEPRTKIFNRGGYFWVLGLKTEGKGTVVESSMGGKTEVLGGLIYPVQIFDQDDQNQSAFINDEASHSLIYAVSAARSFRNYRIQVKETRNSQTKLFLTPNLDGKTMPLFVGYEAPKSSHIFKAFSFKVN